MIKITTPFNVPQRRGVIDEFASPSPYLQWLQYIIYGSLLLYFGRSVLIPLSFAVLISFVLYPVCGWLERRGAGRLTAILLAVSLLVVLGFVLLALLVSQFVTFIEEWPTLQLKIYSSFEDLSKFLVEAFSLSLDQQKNILTRMSDQSGGDIITIIRNTLSASAGSALILFLIPVYAALILYYRQYWVRILHRLFAGEKMTSLREMLMLTIKTYYNFIKGMALVYLIVGVLNSLGLLLLGIPHPFLFGFIASMLTFVPYVGIIVGSLLPITMAWITYDSIWYPMGVVGVFSFVQYLEANVIFPLAVSNRLNVNPLVMLIAIFVGGILWGMAGMILFVPFVGIAKLIADHNPRWKTVSMILGMEKVRAHQDE
jgi:predicted PurR-regulated permease PerM